MPRKGGNVDVPLAKGEEKARKGHCQQNFSPIELFFIFSHLNLFSFHYRVYMYSSYLYIELLLSNIFSHLATAFLFIVILLLYM